MFGPFEPLLSRPRGRIGTDQLIGSVTVISTPQNNARINVAFAGGQVTRRIRKAPLDRKT